MAPLARVLGAMIAAVRDLRPVWEDIREDFFRREARLFNAQGAVPGNPGWAPLSKKYARYKELRGYSPRIMVATGRLMHSLTKGEAIVKGGGTPVAVDAVFVSRPLAMSIGTRVPYAIYHQDPTKRTSWKRPVIVINDQLRRHWVKLLQLFLVESGQMDRLGKQRPPRRRTQAKPRGAA